MKSRESMPFLYSIRTHHLNISVVGYIQNSSLFFRIKRKDYDRKHSIHKNHYNSEKSLNLDTLRQKWHAFPAFFHMKMTDIRMRASMTVEAAMVLPLMIFAIYMLIYPLRLMEAERRLQNVMENTAKELSEAEYLKEAGKSFIDSSKRDTVLGTISGIESGAARAAVLSAVDSDRFEYAVFTEETSILSDDADCDPAMIYMSLSYRMKNPVSAFELIPVNKSLIVNRRAWIGSDGGRGRGKYGDENDDALDDDRIVYLGKTSSEVYHDDPDCHYLSNKLSSTDASEISNLRNGSGGKYHACPSCRPGKTGTVYYFKTGSAYHSTEHCKAITAYSRTARLSELHGMRPCSYCGKNRHG